MARTTKKKVDWDKLHAEWKTGQLSNRGLAKKYQVNEKTIRDRAAAEGWTRDDGDVYRAKVEQKLQAKAAASIKAEYAGKARSAKVKDELSAVADLAAEVGAQVVTCHRNDAKRARGIVNMLFEQLDASASQRDLLLAIAAQLADGEGDLSQEMKGQLATIRKALSLGSHSTIVRDLSVALKNLVYIERGAFNLDKPLKGEGGGAAVSYDVNFG